MTITARYSSHGTQALHLRSWPRFSWMIALAVGVFIRLAIGAAREGASASTSSLALLGFAMAVRVQHDSGAAGHTVLRGLISCGLHQGDGDARAGECKQQPRHWRA